MVPVFILCFVSGRYSCAFWIFFIAAATDIADGAVARYMRQFSQLGAFLDPLADKLLMVSTFACLMSTGVVPVWFFVLLVLRDFMIMSGIGVLKILKIEVEYKPFTSSKLATLSQIFLGLLGLGSMVNPAFQIWRYPITDLTFGCIVVTTVLIFVSGLQYIGKGVEILQKRA